MHAAHPKEDNPNKTATNLVAHISDFPKTIEKNSVVIIVADESIDDIGTITKWDTRAERNNKDVNIIEVIAALGND